MSDDSTDSCSKRIEEGAMTCEACMGLGWRRRQVPHECIPGSLVWVTRPCKFCNGKGTVNVINALSAKDKAANEREESNV